jgi:hypothetical protein
VHFENKNIFLYLNDLAYYNTVVAVNLEVVGLAPGAKSYKN